MPTKTKETHTVTLFRKGISEKEGLKILEAASAAIERHLEAKDQKIRPSNKKPLAKLLRSIDGIPAQARSTFESL
jgi:hypothetical protein